MTTKDLTVSQNKNNLNYKAGSRTDVLQKIIRSISGVKLLF